MNISSPENYFLSTLLESGIKPALDGEVHIWSAFIEQPEPVVLKYYSMLSSEERSRAEKFKLDEIRNRWIVTRGLLRVLIANYYKCNPQEIDFRYNEFGKPFFCSQSDVNNLSFNLSHSENLAVFIFTQSRFVGIDVEKVKQLSSFEDIINLCFSDYEKEWFKTIPVSEKNEVFFKIWTSKEAYIKAIGKGFSFSPDRISLNLNNYNKLFFKEIIGNNNFKKWKLISFMSYPDFICSVVIEGFENEIKQFEIDPKSLVDRNPGTLDLNFSISETYPHF